MGAVGDRLRSERLKSGLGLDRISQETKIPTRYLDAIEQEQFEKLPGQLFLINFVRQYARVLGLDEPQLIAQLRAEQGPPLPEPPHSRLGRRRIGGIAAGAAALLLIFLLAYTAPWSGSAPRVPVPPRGTRSVSSGSADRMVSFAPVAPAPRPPVAAAGLRLVLIARERTWVDVKWDGHSAFAGTLQPSESRVLEGSASVDLVIGNPEGLELSVDGKPIDITGPRGQLAEVRIAAPDAPPAISHRQPLADLY